MTRLEGNAEDCAFRLFRLNSGSAGLPGYKSQMLSSPIRIGSQHNAHHHLLSCTLERNIVPRAALQQSDWHIRMILLIIKADKKESGCQLQSLEVRQINVGGDCYFS